MVRKLKIKNQEKTIDFNKIMSKLIKGTKISECLWNEECSKDEKNLIENLQSENIIDTLYTSR